MKGRDRLLRVSLEVVEVRRPIALVHALENGKVDLERLLDLLEHAPQAAGGRVGHGVLGAAVVEQVEIYLRSDRP